MTKRLIPGSKLIVGVIVGVIVFVMLLSVGCSRVPATKDLASPQITLTLWSIANESDTFNHAYKQAIADYERLHPDVDIVFESFENQSYKTKIKSAVAANELPDIFYSWGGGFSKAFVESGKVLPIDPYYTALIKEELSEAALSSTTYNGKHYGVTYTTPVSALFYNKQLFSKYGIEVPTSWKQLVEAVATFKEKGITPIGVSVKDTWVLAMCHDGLALKSAGPEKVAKALTHGGQSYDDPDFLLAATKLQELVQMGAFNDSATTLSNDEAAALFYNGVVPMYISGSWMGGSIYSEAEEPTDFDVTPIPILDGDKAQLSDFMGGAIDTLMVSATTKHPDIAGEAVFEIAKSISKYAYLDGSGIAAWKKDYDDQMVNPITKKLADFAVNATSFTIWFDTLMDADDANAYLSLLQELYMGTLTPEQFTQAMARQLKE